MKIWYFCEIERSITERDASHTDPVNQGRMASQPEAIRLGHIDYCWNFYDFSTNGICLHFYLVLTSHLKEH